MTRGTVFHPDWYRQNIIPWYREIWAPLKRAGIKVIMVSDGNYSALVDDIFDAGADGCFSEPLVDLGMLATRHSDKILFSGADTRILTNGTPADVAADVRNKMALGHPAPGHCFMAAGGTPQNCPTENVDALFAEFEALRGRQ
jgi:uroporphyrinogen-III decarboxylase